MRGVILPDGIAASDLRAHVSNALAYPRSGVDRGGGIHVPASMSQTTNHTHFVQHPTSGQWAVIVDSVVESIPTTQAFLNRIPSAKQTAVRTAIQSAVELEASWFPVAT